jgi:hypothetical protein
MSENHPSAEVDPSEGGLDDASNSAESASAGQAEEQVDPSEGAE